MNKETDTNMKKVESLQKQNNIKSLKMELEEIIDSFKKRIQKELSENILEVRKHFDEKVVNQENWDLLRTTYIEYVQDLKMEMLSNQKQLEEELRKELRCEIDQVRKEFLQNFKPNTRDDPEECICKKENIQENETRADTSLTQSTSTERLNCAPLNRMTSKLLM